MNNDRGGGRYQEKLVVFYLFYECPSLPTGVHQLSKFVRKRRRETDGRERRELRQVKMEGKYHEGNWMEIMPVSVLGYPWR